MAKRKKKPKKEKKVKAIEVPPPWNPTDHKAEYLEALKTESNNARLRLSGQLLAVMHGQTEEKDGDPIPAPVLNLGSQLKGLVEQIATKKAIATFDQMKVIHEKERHRLMVEKVKQDAAIAEATKAVEAAAGR